MSDDFVSYKRLFTIQFVSEFLSLPFCDHAITELNAKLKPELT